MGEHRRGGDEYAEKFLFVAGHTPHIITETLYYFARVARPRIASGDVHVLTTASGKRAIVEALFRGRPSGFRRFLEALGSTCVNFRFRPGDVVVLRNRLGQCLDDVRTTEDNAAAADQIVEWVRAFADDPRSRLHGSIAGGRKTMSYYLAAAFWLYGRPQDTLSHVLVSPSELEGSEMLFSAGGKRGFVSVEKASGSGRVERHRAKIDLASVPFLRLRGLLPLVPDPKRAPLNELVAKSQEALARLQMPPPLRFEEPARIEIAGTRIAFTRLQSAIYRLAAERRRDCPSACPGCSRCWVPATEILGGAAWERLKELADAAGADIVPHKWKRGLARFRQERSKINRAIASALGKEAWTASYAVASARMEGAMHYGLRLPSRLIELP